MSMYDNNGTLNFNYLFYSKNTPKDDFSFSICGLKANLVDSFIRILELPSLKWQNFETFAAVIGAATGTERWFSSDMGD